MVMLNDADTCEPLALMSGNLISSVRTGCVPGVAAKHLAKKDAKVCACIGAGPVSKACFEGIVHGKQGIEELVVCDLFLDKAEAFAKEMGEKYGIKAIGVTSIEEAVKDADIISVAASPVKPIQFKDEWLKKGSLLIFSGRGGVDGDYFTDAKIVWDNAKMHEVYYDEHLLLPENERFINGIAVQIYRLMYEGKLPEITKGTSLGDVLCTSGEGRVSEDERICFIASGMPVWDVAWGYQLYENAKAKGLGTTLKLWDSCALL
jgi:ornithine cyclodeaminase